MDQRIGKSLARGLAALAAPLLLLGVMAGLAPAASAALPPNVPGGRTPATGGLAAAPASLQAAIRGSLGTAPSPAGYFQQAKLAPAGAAAGDQVGYTVALSAAGTTALVGAPDHNTAIGAAYVFTLRHGTWSRTAELTAADGAQEDTFGTSVALSAAGTAALVGAPGHNKDTGAAYLFTLRHRTWSQTAELTATHGAQDDLLGYSVALSATGTTALAGAPEVNQAAGAAYVFTLRHHAWSQRAELTASDAVAGDGLGQSVALSAAGTTALTGAPNRNNVSGAAYVFTLRRGAWTQTAELAGAARDGFGLSVALSGAGTTALAGAPFHNSNTGAAYLFTLRRRTWSRTAVLAAASSAHTFGQSVALSARGTTALAGAVQNQPLIGAAFAYTLRHHAWSQTAELTAADGVAADGFGQSVALSAAGTTALAGAPEGNDATGAAYVFVARRGA
jgi:hypothetical protein